MGGSRQKKNDPGAHFQISWDRRGVLFFLLQRGGGYFYLPGSIVSILLNEMHDRESLIQFMTILCLLPSKRNITL